MLNTIRKYISNQHLLSEGGRVIVALSGGADSVVLLHVLLSLGYKCMAAHCNFHLRGEESERDMHFVHDICQQLGVPLQVKHFDTRTYAAEHGISIEMAARELRYSWFAELSKTEGGIPVAVAHHINDQAETLLLNLSRGTGLKGLGGMRPKTTLNSGLTVIRPLLCVTRREIEVYAAENNLTYVTDSTNTDTAIRRNAWRSMLANVPETDIRHFAESAALMQQYHTLLHDLLHGTTVSEEAAPTLLYELLAPYGFNAAQTHDILRSLGTSGRRFEAPSFTAVTEHGKLIVESHKPDNINLNTSDETNHSINRIVRARKQTEVYPAADSMTAFFDADTLPEHLALRHWREGDFFYPLTNNSHPVKKKLQDYFCDCKVSVTDKQQTLLLCDADSPSTIIWIVGFRQDNRFKVTTATSEVAEIMINKVNIVNI